ncbi:hypothetical protein PG997_012069 [Apiospora hydei]|uniref:Uncharacterized protein n=1 Tax=Apiospora hydei TaxID=1337664 RepID=A0ABR1V2C5_9PEZI
MGRLGPLTSQALGRSPYDDVVMGTGEADPREPPRQYDEKGRVVNPETKSVIKSMIRAHNEVMHVIGVAEPDDPSASGFAETKDTASSLVQDQLEYENSVAQALIPAGRLLADIGTWALEGVRQRSLVYRPYCHIEFTRLWQFELSRRTNSQMALVGLQAYLPARALEYYFKNEAAFVRSKPWLVSGLVWCNFHFEIFTILQRLDLIPSSTWLPSPMFFVPFSSASPFVAPPRMETISASSVTAWAGQLAVNLAPYAGYYLMKRLISRLDLGTTMFRLLPRPHNNGFLLRASDLRAPPPRPPQESHNPHIPESPTLGAADREIRHVRNPSQDAATLQALEGGNNVAAAATATATAEQGIAVGALRRHSTFSNRGANTNSGSGTATATGGGGGGSGEQDYGTDEEDTDMINPTLISFDVDTSETTEPPAGVWSAELRPSYSNNGGGQPSGGGGANHDNRSSWASSGSASLDKKFYMVTPLTLLPTTLAADNLCRFLVNVACSPIEALILRAMARGFVQTSRALPQLSLISSSGTGIDQLLPLNLHDFWSFRRTGSALALNFLQLLVSAEVWTFMTVVSQSFHVSEEVWREMREEEEAEEAEEEEAAAAAERERARQRDNERERERELEFQRMVDREAREMREALARRTAERRAVAAAVDEEERMPRRNGAEEQEQEPPAI